MRAKSHTAIDGLGNPLRIRVQLPTHGLYDAPAMILTTWACRLRPFGQIAVQGWQQKFWHLTTATASRRWL